MGTGPTIANTIGATIVGWGVSSLVFGFLCIQTWTYYQQYPKDSPAYKILVAILWSLEGVHQALIGHAVWFYVVQHYGELLVFLQPPVWSLPLQVVLGALAGAIVKICFGMRVWKFSKHNYAITFIIIALALAQLAMASLYTVKAFHTRLAEASDLRVIGSASLALGAATDIITAGALSYFLHKMRTGYSRSDTLINRLIIYSVNTGMVTRQDIICSLSCTCANACINSVCSISVVIMYDLMDSNFIYMGTYFVLSKLYANSCLATLNSRRFVRGKGTDREEVTGPTFMMVSNPFRVERPHLDDKLHYSPGGLEVGVHHAVSVTSDSVSPASPQYAKAW
ncbi:hypothetical protein BV25DRAFT_1918387 [Artomyces pyxidatus]|uniref:Uncharacterized protein n=1 Tax=Artomyces pyxidatus TaxID=48021 RepID=A0ACB8ST25_9AGAM|nr:hypothetical protein BV25DRAFT_1918387 [Artomyces pyxidatus]